MCVDEQAPKSSKYDFSKIYIQNYKNQKFLGRVRWVRYMYGEPSKPSEPYLKIFDFLNFEYKSLKNHILELVHLLT